MQFVRNALWLSIILFFMTGANIGSYNINKDVNVESKAKVGSSYLIAENKSQNTLTIKDIIPEWNEPKRTLVV